MSKLISGFAVLIFLSVGTLTHAADAPQSLAGFGLGRSISDFEAKIKKETNLPIRYAEFIRQVEIQAHPYYKSGLIAFGDCAFPGRIIQVKLKYIDPSRNFYQTLLKRFKAKFGPPNRFVGDSFGAVMAWKWMFKDKEKGRISLTLQHNIKDPEQKLGNSVKLTCFDYYENERKCFEKKYPDVEKIPDKRKLDPKKIDWKQILPQ